MKYTFDKEKTVLGRLETGLAGPKLDLAAGEVFTQAKKDAFASECFSEEGVEVIELIVCQSFYGRPSMGSSWQSSSHGTKWMIYKKDLEGKWFLSKTESKVD